MRYKLVCASCMMAAAVIGAAPAYAEPSGPRGMHELRTTRSHQLPRQLRNVTGVDLQRTRHQQRQRRQGKSGIPPKGIELAVRPRLRQGNRGWHRHAVSGQP